MPRRSSTPGLKWRKRADGSRVPYWVASQITRDPLGFPDPAIPLPEDASLEELSSLCIAHTARLDAWLVLAISSSDPNVPRYDGTIMSLSRIYQRHADSPFRDVKRNTADSYVDSLKIIEASVGARLVRNVTVVDVKRWWRNWMAPAPKKRPDAPDNPERPKRAYDAVSALRMILRFGDALGHEDCGALVNRLAKVRFERPGAREAEMTVAQAMAFVRKALELGERDMAIGIAAQFELMLRQKDIIGEWGPSRPGIIGATYVGDEMWTGPFRWEAIPGWRLRLKTSKTRARAEFDLTGYPILLPLLESVPHDERHGAIVKGEHGLPVRERSYRKWFREIARAAGIPDEVWSMDSRAGGATEAHEAGADFMAISQHLTHADARTTVRYIRRTGERIATVAKARADARKKATEGEP